MRSSRLPPAHCSGPDLATGITLGLALRAAWIRGSGATCADDGKGREGQEEPCTPVHVSLVPFLCGGERSGAGSWTVDCGRWTVITNYFMVGCPRLI